MAGAEAGPPAIEPLRLEPIAEATRRARDYVREALLELGRADLIECAVFGVSELVTNACLHARTAVTVVVRAPTPDGRVRIEVADSSPLLPSPRRHARWSTTGRGLRLLDSAGEWGVLATQDGKTVWFEPAEEMSEDGFGLLEEEA